MKHIIAATAVVALLASLPLTTAQSGSYCNVNQPHEVNFNLYESTWIDEWTTQGDTFDLTCLDLSTNTSAPVSLHVMCSPTLNNKGRAGTATFMELGKVTLPFTGTTTFSCPIQGYFYLTADYRQYDQNDDKDSSGQNGVLHISYYANGTVSTSKAAMKKQQQRQLRALGGVRGNAAAVTGFDFCDQTPFSSTVNGQSSRGILYWPNSAAGTQFELTCFQLATNVTTAYTIAAYCYQYGSSTYYKIGELSSAYVASGSSLTFNCPVSGNFMLRASSNEVSDFSGATNSRDITYSGTAQTVSSAKKVALPGRPRA